MSREIIPFTIWDTTTGEIRQAGITTVTDTLKIPEGCKLWEGDALSPESHIFNKRGKPIERTSPRRKNRDDLINEINRERDRRVDLGKDCGGIWISGRDKDQTVMLALKDTARDLKEADIDRAILPFKDAKNVEHMLTADEFIAAHNEAKKYLTSIARAAWALKAMDPIPQDISADKYWP